MSYLIEYIARILSWLLGLVTWALLQILKLLYEGLSVVINAIPVPSWLSGAGSVFASIPSGVAFFTASLHIVDGIAIVLSAYGLRFLIRRIPFIG